MANAQTGKVPNELTDGHVERGVKCRRVPGHKRNSWSYARELCVTKQKMTEGKYIITRLVFPGASSLQIAFIGFKPIIPYNDVARYGITIISAYKEGSRDSESLWT